MEKARRSYEDISPTGPNYSRVVRAGATLYISGVTAWRSEAQGGPPMDQLRVVLDRITRIVAAEGGGPSDIVRCTTYVTDISDWWPVEGEHRGIWDEYFGGEYPAHSLIGVSSLAEPGLDVEVEATGGPGLDADPAAEVAAVWRVCGRSRRPRSEGSPNAVEAYRDELSLYRDGRNPLPARELLELRPRLRVQRQVDLIVRRAERVELLLERARVVALWVGVDYQIVRQRLPSSTTFRPRSHCSRLHTIFQSEASLPRLRGCVEKQKQEREACRRARRARTTVHPE